MLSKFAVKLKSAVHDFHSVVSKSRSDLEHQSPLDSGTTTDAVRFITFVQDLKKKMVVWKSSVEVFRNGQKLMEKQRFSFPKDWIYMEAIDGEWGAFLDIFNRKNGIIQDQLGNLSKNVSKYLAALQAQIVAEDKILHQKINDSFADWEKNKPIQGNLKPSDAITTLSAFDTYFLY